MGPSVEICRRPAHRTLALRIGYCRGNSDRRRFGDFVLHRKDVGEIAIVTLGPDMLAALGLNTLRGDANAIAGFAQAAFEHIAHTKFAADLLHVDRTALVGEGRIARDDEL